MKVLLLSSYDIAGGAARAAYRLHQGLQQIDVKSQILAQVKSSDDAQVIAPTKNLLETLVKLRVSLNSLPLQLYSQRTKAPFSIQWLPDTIPAKIQQIQPDIINLHWIAGGFVKIETIAQFKQPVVWSLHDMWAFTGGCHYDDGCDRYTQSCGTCPQLNSQTENDLSRWVWRRKAKAWKSANITVVALSQWLAKSAQSSSLFRDRRIEVIPNGIDIETYRPISRQWARELLRLPLDKQLVLFGSLKATSDRRKGFHLLQPALQSLSQAGWGDRLELVVIGASQPEEPPDLGFNARYLGTLHDDLSLALIYAAVDVFVLPSVQENLANTVMEAIACGTPCVAFNVGGMPDLIEHQQNGYLARPYEIEDLAKGIAWVLEHQERYEKLSDRARRKAEQEFTLEQQARRYSALFQELLQEQP
jgi:glycosyltransferase involved in cell wall biosynthesis